MKKIVFPFLGILMLGLSSCVEPKGDNIHDFQLVPAIVDYSFAGDMLNTFYGPVKSTEIQKATDLFAGDVILAFFTVNYDQQISEDYTMVYNFDYVRVLSATVIETAGGQSTTGDFNHPIEEIKIFGWVNNHWFVGFVHKEGSTDDFFFYEMTYDDNEPIVYIRAKKPNTGNIKGVSICAFNMIPFFYKHKDADNKVTFSIHYKTGVDNEGNDVFRPFYDEHGYDKYTITIE